ncbi:hypothetical protein, conserved [Babesia bigemina]|uniref:Uncharacterized protein n=1 Tax=Babesia bigemina TaxID=5866 RepID=A0A061D0H5_BABBI|nr:hypothetical protein, conserved [Babesia bigemina]CDR94173.1 hypothetical protein, conserved [Babesia bigemina]|eukprot:XP_012766359.1 hypothetical protein, conserved [Babesia bigemina]
MDHIGPIAQEGSPCDISMSETLVGYCSPEEQGYYVPGGMAQNPVGCYYDEGFVPAGADYMSTTYYQNGPEDLSKTVAPPMYVYSEPPIAPMAGYSSPYMYGPMDLTFFPSGDPVFYGMPCSTMAHMVGAAKAEIDDDARTFAECSTAATTPHLRSSVNPEMVDDGFDLAYSPEYESLPMPAVDSRFSTGVAPDGNYYKSVVNFEDAFSPCRYTDAMANDAVVVEIANEIAANVQYLPDKESSGKYSLDKNHPIHCVWRDLNRGHCSWRCRWWENGKRLSKNFNVKRFGEWEAMWMAIAMKIRNSTPVERFQLLKEQREAVRNYCELASQHAGSTVTEDNYMDAAVAAVPPMGLSPRKKRQPANSAKCAQKANWARIAWTYVMVSDRRPSEVSVVCRLCAKTTKCSRSRNLQQAHIMHLIRMHKNPWKKYLDVEGLTKMCSSALDALYKQQGFTEDSEWKLRPGIVPPEPDFEDMSMHYNGFDDE